MLTNNEENLCVDLDGTLIEGDMFFESFLSVLKSSPLSALWSIWLLLTAGKSRAKSFLADRFVFNPSLLPYNAEVVTLIRSHREIGGQAWLVSATDYRILEKLRATFSCLLAYSGPVRI